MKPICSINEEILWSPSRRVILSITSRAKARVTAPPALEARREEDRYLTLVDAAERISDAVEAERPGTAIRGIVED